MPSPYRKPFPWGALQGHVALSDAALAAARAEAAQYYAECEAEEFCGDQVGSLLPPAWLPPVRDWFPMNAVRELGFEPELDGRIDMLATVGVDPHEDDIIGPTFILCLANDGLEFGQGEHRHVTQPGQWFIFDDVQSHVVQESEQTTTYLCLSIPLKPLSAAAQT